MPKSVLFIPLPQWGHINPTLPIAAGLAGQGALVTYIGPALFERTIRSAGARLEPLDASDLDSRLSAVLARFGSADLLLIDSVLRRRRSFALLGDMKRTCWYSTSLLNWTDSNGEKDAGPVLVLCAGALELPKFRSVRPDNKYCEPGLFETAQPSPKRDRSSRPLVLVSFGTQSIRHRHLLKHYQLVAGLASETPECDFIVAEHQDLIAGQVDWPDNVSLAGRIEQPMFLKSCSAFVTHGGLGGIREAVYASVPLLVLPSFGDQFFNAMRVRYHGIGYSFFEEKQTMPNVFSALEKALSGSLAEPIARMRDSFIAERDARTALRELENSF